MSLAGWTLADSAPTPTTYVIPNGYSVPANGRLLIWADDETIQNTGSGQLHVPFKLSNSGETLTLRAPDGSAAIDSLANASAAAANFTALAKPTATASPTAGVITFTITTTPGFTYQTQYKNELPDAAWTNIGPVTTATGATITITDNPGARTHRF